VIQTKDLEVQEDQRIEYLEYLTPLTSGLRLFVARLVILTPITHCYADTSDEAHKRRGILNITPTFVEVEFHSTLRKSPAG
jgi:hypothetical protein